MCREYVGFHSSFDGFRFLDEFESYLLRAIFNNSRSTQPTRYKPNGQ